LILWLQCISCGITVPDYTLEFVKQMNTKYGDNKAFQDFFNNFIKDPDSIRNECVNCRCSKWERLKYPNHSKYNNILNNKYVVDFYLPNILHVF